MNSVILQVTSRMTFHHVLTCVFFMGLVHSGKSGDESCDVSDVMIPDGRLVTRANCKHRHLTEIPMLLPDSTVILHLQSNDIIKLRRSLTSFYKLEILNLACNAIQKLEAQNFMNMSSLRELDVSECIRLRFIERDAFMHLPRLKVLNMACDRFIGYLPVMRAMAAAPFLLDTLVIDAISDQLTVLSPEQFNASSLSHLKRLSLRYDKIVTVDVRVLQQITTIEHLNLGYNSPIGSTNDYDDDVIVREYITKFLGGTKLITLDISNMYNNEWRPKYCDVCSGENLNFMDYFQFPNFHVSDIKQINNRTDHKVHYNCFIKDFNITFDHMPPSLRFVYASDVLWFAKGRIYHEISLCQNNIQYINMSGTNIGGFYGNLYGLESLEVLDFSRCEIFVLPTRFMTHFPKLRVLLMGHNNIPNTTSVIGTSHNLEILDLSSNKIKNVPRDTFRGFTKLQNLDLRRNLLENVDFDVSDLISLSHLDLSFNNIHSFDDSFMKGLNELSRITKFSISLQGNPLVCSCEFTTFVAWIKQIFDAEHNIDSADGGSLDCLYLNETSYNISDVGYDQLTEVCSDRVKLVDNLLKTALIPVMTIVLMCGLVAVLCYILRHQIWWEWHVVIRGGKQVDIGSFTQHAFVACDDNGISKGFILHLEQSIGTRIDSSPYLDPNGPEMEQNGQRMESSKKVMFFVDLSFINNLNEWNLYIPDVVKSHYIKHIALVLDPNVMESSLHECRVLWRLSKLRQCFMGFYNGRDTNSDVFKKIQEFMKPDVPDDFIERSQHNATSVDERSPNQNLQTTASADDDDELLDQNQQHTSVDVQSSQQERHDAVHDVSIGVNESDQPFHQRELLAWAIDDEERVLSPVDGEVPEQPQPGHSDTHSGNKHEVIEQPQPGHSDTHSGNKHEVPEQPQPGHSDTHSGNKHEVIEQPQPGHSDTHSENKHEVVECGQHVELYMSEEHVQTNQQFMFDEDDRAEEPDFLIDNTCEMIPLYPHS